MRQMLCNGPLSFRPSVPSITRSVAFFGAGRRVGMQAISIDRCTALRQQVPSSNGAAAARQHGGQQQMLAVSRCQLT